VKYVLKTSTPARRNFDLDRDLNPQQRAVVDAPPGRLLVLAGAGTGKTRALTYRVARLVERGCPPERVLLCTFTNRAAREMVARVEELIAVDMRRCAAGTFHHVGNRILRHHGEAIGISPDFGILDPEDARILLATVIAEQGLAKLTAKRFPQAKLLHSLIGLATGMQRPLDELVEARAPRLLEQLATMRVVATAFAERKRALNLCDFDDLLAHWQRLLVDPRTRDVAERITNTFDHVLVDEYQDINALQGEICDLMAVGHGSLTCVGDDAQSIYSFRGADFGKIHGFVERHADARILELTVNYRSTPQILDLANRSIAHNARQHAKELRSVRRAGVVPVVVALRDVFQQAEFVAQRVLEIHHEQNLALRRMAVLYRNHSHSLELQVELTRRQIPYRVRSGVRFFEQAHIKDVVAYLRARENPRDALAWMRLLRLWPGVGAQTAEILAGALTSASVPPTAVLRERAASARGRARSALVQLAELFAALSDPVSADPTSTIRTVVERHYADYAERTFTNAPARKDDLEHLAAFAGRYPDAREFLAEFALFEGISAETLMAADRPDDHLTLSTIHQAKGLEWPVCLVLGLAEGKFPMPQSVRNPWDLEEERRLFYVACTRAADELYLCFPTVEDGREGPTRLLRPSRFLSELDSAPPVFDRWQIEEQPA
jgi:DNA helicase-2/ATP-dependent DNA helicase PcrA